MILEQDSELLKALGHPVRLTIVKGLCDKECNVNKIADKLGLPQPTISQHLAILKNRGILEAERDGTTICYKVADEKVKRILKALDY